MLQNGDVVSKCILFFDFNSPDEVGLHFGYFFNSRAINILKPKKKDFIFPLSIAIKSRMLWDDVAAELFVIIFIHLWHFCIMICHW